MKGGRGFDIREKAPLLAAILFVWLAANLAVTFLMIVPRSERADALREAAADFQQKLNARRQKVDRARAEYERVMGGRQTLETFYQDVLSTKRDRMTAFQREIREIATKFSIRPDQISYSRYLFPKDRMVKFSAVLPLSGSYENLRAFISALENSENFLILEAVNLTDSKEGGVILSLNIAVATYFLDPDVELKEGAEGGRI